MHILYGGVVLITCIHMLKDHFTGKNVIINIIPAPMKQPRIAGLNILHKSARAYNTSTTQYKTTAMCIFLRYFEYRWCCVYAKDYIVSPWAYSFVYMYFSNSSQFILNFGINALNFKPVSFYPISCDQPEIRNCPCVYWNSLGKLNTSNKRGCVTQLETHKRPSLSMVYKDSLFLVLRKCKMLLNLR